MRRLLPLLLLACSATAAAQEAVVRGIVRDAFGTPLPQATVSTIDGTRGMVCADDGAYELKLPAGDTLRLRFSFTGMLPRIEQVVLRPGETRTLNVALEPITLRTLEVEADRLRREQGVERIDPRLARVNPRPLGGVESLLVGQLGVTMRSELSSAYSVRGGNYDENLVYVNDIEVYRPFLVRAGQQEGLSFPNPDMIERIEFSAGGFEPRFGDKLSSVLDIRYKRPKTFAGSAMAGLMGGSLHLEGPVASARLRHVTGLRYRTNTLLLKGLDTQGAYRPAYTDLQSYWTYDLTPTVELGLLGLYSVNRYNLVPESRETDYGTFNQALRFKVFFEGQEVTRFETLFGALNANVRPHRDLLLKFTASAFNTYETETFDILGEYFLGELERDPASEQFGQVVSGLGIGAYLDHARNTLEATVYTLAHKGYLQHGHRYLQWGADLRAETITDRLSEWTMTDSAGYSVPLNSAEDLLLGYSLKSRLNMESLRASGYVQNTWRWERAGGRRWSLIAGVRGQHWTYNGQTVVSPRARLTWHPAWKRVNAKGDTLDRDHDLWFAAGLYAQPPFYREVRRPDGTLNPDIRAQQSLHLVLGWDRYFEIWQRPFQFTTEVYYKHLTDVIPYQVENVRIRYLGENNARAYATGVDMRLAGEFVKGLESWVSLGVLGTQEDIRGDAYLRRYNAAGQQIVPGYTFDQVAVDSVRVEPGWIPRPTDQRVNVAIFFQDEMPRWPTFKVHLSLVFGTGLPFGPQGGERYADTLRTPIYRRVDIGFSKQLLGAMGQEKTGFLRRIDDLWLSLEVFNLLNINNTIDYQWIAGVDRRYYAIPEFLTPRRFNFKVSAWF